MDAERLTDTPANRRMLERAGECWREMTEEALRRGYYGRACVELTIADGTVQAITRQFSRVEK